MASVPTFLLYWLPLIIVLLIIVFIIIPLIVRWYIRKPMYRSLARIDGKTVVITGGNSGIGKETAKDLVKRGGRVILLCRDPERGRVASEEIAEVGSSVDVYQVDLSSLESIRECASQLKEKEPKIDILINNAGIMLTPKLETKDGLELQFGTNHLGHFLLTLLLLDNIKRASPSRIINVSSLAHIYGRMHWADLNLKNSYRPDKAYTQSKLANILFTKALAEKLKGTGVSTYALHPGLVHTELYRHITTIWGSFTKSINNIIGKFFYKTPLQGAQTSIFCAVDESIAEHSGRYYSGCKEKLPSQRARNMEDAERLWAVSLELVGMEDFTI